MKSQELVKVWDRPLRIFHWLVVTGFLAAFLTEDDLLTVHVWAGYLVLGLLLFRLLWGFLGDEYAKFSNFICNPAESALYFKDVITLKTKRYLGHNPAGAAMIILLLISLVMTSITGFAVYGADQGAGPLALIMGSNNEKLWKEVHEFFANFTLFLVFAHVAGVL